MFNVIIQATIDEKDPAYKRIAEIGIEKAIDKFTKDLRGNGTVDIKVSIEEVKNESSKD